MPSSASIETPTPPVEDHWPGGLPALRAELDRLDDAMHALLLKRAKVVEHVARAGKRAAWRPGREASIVRRLLHNHSGSLPPQTVVRIWRELLAGTTAMQGPFALAVCEPKHDAAYTQVAREHFGALTPLHAFGSPAQAMAEVARGAAAVAVLPLPSETDSARDAWWTGLLQNEQPRIYVVARLPFWAAPRPDSAPHAQALVVATTAPDPSEADRSILGLELDMDVSRARLTSAFAAVGLQLGTVILRRTQGAPVAHALADVEGFITDDDPRLARLQSVQRPPLVLGAYAVPATGATA
jgi:chorismate mutase / prephenate dehydratase